MIADRDPVTSGWIQILMPIADDEWIVAHRGSEWLGLAPDLEEDLAFSSINQDEMGHAQFYYELLTTLGEPAPDQMIYLRAPEQWRNARILEAVQGDWAQTMALRYFYEVFDDIRQQGLSQSSFLPLREGISKIRREEAYHLQHFDTWFDMLALGTDESRARLTEAIHDIWPELGGLFSWGQSRALLTAMDLDALQEGVMKETWENRVRVKFEQARLAWPGLALSRNRRQTGVSVSILRI
jgi:ring-1,2-phenylacetyl-CoA epoxidase subunit PaaC